MLAYINWPVLNYQKRLCVLSCLLHLVMWDPTLDLSTCHVCLATSQWPPLTEQWAVKNVTTGSILNVVQYAAFQRGDCDVIWECPLCDPADAELSFSEDSFNLSFNSRPPTTRTDDTNKTRLSDTDDYQYQFTDSVKPCTKSRERASPVWGGDKITWSRDHGWFVSERAGHRTYAWE